MRRLIRFTGKTFHQRPTKENDRPAAEPTAGPEPMPQPGPLNGTTVDARHSPPVGRSGADPGRTRKLIPAPYEKRILIIEKDGRLYQSMASLMGDHYELVWTQAAQEALRLSLEKRFDLILLDVNVADMDAWKALNWLRLLHPLWSLTMITERPDQSRRAEIFGATHVLEKPVNHARLPASMLQLLSEPHGTAPLPFEIGRDGRAYAD